MNHCHPNPSLCHGPPPLSFPFAALPAQPPQNITINCDNNSHHLMSPPCTISHCKCIPAMSHRCYKPPSSASMKPCYTPQGKRSQKFLYFSPYSSFAFFLSGFIVFIYFIFWLISYGPSILLPNSVFFFFHFNFGLHVDSIVHIYSFEFYSTSYIFVLTYFYFTC